MVGHACSCRQFYHDNFPSEQLSIQLKKYTVNSLIAVRFFLKSKFKKMEMDPFRRKRLACDQIYRHKDRFA